jgi:hypothetical protein
VPRRKIVFDDTAEQQRQAEKAAALARSKEQKRLDKLKKDEDRKQVALAKINAAGVPQQTLNSLLSGVETLQRFATGEAGVSDPANIGAPVGTAATPTASQSILSRLMKSVGLPILIGLAVTALWYVLKPKH